MTALIFYSPTRIYMLPGHCATWQELTRQYRALNGEGCRQAETLHQRIITHLMLCETCREYERAMEQGPAEDYRLPEQQAQEIWRQLGGCMQDHT